MSPADSDAAESQLLQTRELDERGIIQTYIVSKYRSSESPCEPSINTQAHKCMHDLMTVVLLLTLFAKDTLPLGLWSDEGVCGGAFLPWGVTHRAGMRRKQTTLIGGQEQS